MKRIAFGTMLAAVALMTACDNPFGDDDGEVVFTARESAYVAGDTARVRLVNDSDETIVYSLCALDIDVREGGAWHATEFEIVLPCLGMVTVLEPGESVNGFAPLSADMPAGEYRVRTSVHEVDEQPEDVATRGFEVAAAVD